MTPSQYSFRYRIFNYKPIYTTGMETFDDQEFLNKCFMMQMKDIQNNTSLL